MEKVENVGDQDKILIQNSIKYLDSLTKIKELNVPTLKSLYRTKCRLMELRRHVYLPREKPNYRCQRCFMNFSEGPTKYEVKPTKLSDFAKKVISKVNNHRILTTFQKVYYKKLKKKFPNGFGNQNKMIITCNYCKNESEIWMTKPKKTPMSSKNIVTPAKKKKKSKKDKFCGLNENAVSQLTAKRKNQHNENNLNHMRNNLNGFSDRNRIISNSNNNHLNTSISITNPRVFETADFIPLNTKSKKGNKIKFSSRKVNNNIPLLRTISKSKEKLQKKNLKNLGNMLGNMVKKSSENKNRQSSNLKHFLAGL